VPGPEKPIDAAEHRLVVEIGTYIFPDHIALRGDFELPGSGADTVRYNIELPDGLDASKLVVSATLYYQSIPPSWLRQRFTTAPHMAATQRLQHIVGRLDLKGTALENWKFRLVSVERPVASTR